MLNVGCGNKIARQWTNIDMVALEDSVIEHDLSQGIPFDTGAFDVVYHSQVLEHFALADGRQLMDECFRVLRADGVIRVVVPDLEASARAYLECLDEARRESTAASEANHHWMVLELLDQSVRDKPGGKIAEYLEQPEIVNEEFVVARGGRVLRRMREALEARRTQAVGRRKRENPRWRRIIQWNLRWACWQGRLVRLLMPGGVSHAAIGRLRSGGEIHRWLYDEFSLSRLLRECGFVDICRVDARTSRVPNWSSFELDVRDGEVCDPSSLFMEARKPE